MRPTQQIVDDHSIDDPDDTTRRPSMTQRHTR
jgi:hypothetical protein